MIGNCFKTVLFFIFYLVTEKFSFGNMVCLEWNKRPGWVVNVESMNNLKEKFESLSHG